MDELIRNVLLFALFFCVIPTLLLTVIVFFAFRRFMSNLSPDVEKIQQEFDKMRDAAPNATREALVQKMIRRQAFKAGVVGAITSFGGLFTLPITLPLDVLLSLQIQQSMVDFIAASYGKARVNQIEARARTYLVMTGGLKATESTISLLMRFFTRVLGKSFAKLIPFVGAIVGFAVNYSIANATGQLAVRWYSGSLGEQANRLMSNPPPQLKG